MRAEPSEGVFNVTAGDRVLVVVTEADARVEAIELPVVARVYADSIRRAVRAYRDARRPAVLLDGARRAAGATAAFAAALLALLWAFARLRAWLTRRYQERIHSVQFQSFEILRAQRIRDALDAVMRFVRLAASVVLVYFWLHVVLSSFPVTRPLALRLLSLVLEPLSLLGAGLLAQLPNLLFLLVLYFVTRWLLGLMRLFFDAVAKGRVEISGFEPEWALPTYRIVRLVVVGLALVVAYPYIPGSQSAAFKGLSIFLGVMLSLGSSSFISNIIAGYSMTYRRAFQVGDRIKVGETFGDVTEIRLQVTHLRTLKNEEIVVPNSTHPQQQRRELQRPRAQPTASSCTPPSASATRRRGGRWRRCCSRRRERTRGPAHASPRRSSCRRRSATSASPTSSTSTATRRRRCRGSTRGCTGTSSTSSTSTACRS